MINFQVFEMKKIKHTLMINMTPHEQVYHIPVLMLIYLW